MAYLIINGPNLNLLGKREPELYGAERFEDYLSQLRRSFPEETIDYFQSNSEGALLDRLHVAGYRAEGIILNAGAYTHTSIALADAIAAVPVPVIEVHISNVFQRETFRHHSYLSPVCLGSISGFGLDGYRMALEHLMRRQGNADTTPS